MNTITDQVEIKAILKRISQDRVEVKVWQNLKNDTRLTSYAVIFKHDEQRDEFLCIQSRGDFEFVSDSEIYFFFEKRSMVFKSKLAFGSTQKIAIKMPTELMMSEARIDERKDYLGDDLDVQFHFGNSIQGKIENFPFSSKLLDGSQKGASFISNLANISKFHIGDLLTLKLPHENNKVVEGRIRHISNHFANASKSGKFKVGVAFL